MCTHPEETAVSLTAASRRPARRTRLTAAAIAMPLALGAVLTGCSAGQITQTAEKRSSVAGSQAATGDLKVLNAYLVAPGDEGKYQSGDTVGLEFVVTSTGAGDEITSITVDGEEASITSSGTSAGGSTTSPAATDAAGAIEVPPGGITVVGEDGDWTVEHTMTDETYPATLVPVVITFEDAGEVSFQVPVAAPGEEIERDPDQVYTPEEGEGGGH